jgi:hypothetical protein
LEGNFELNHSFLLCCLPPFFCSTKLRDCYYKFVLEDQPHFEILNQRTIWSSCIDEHQSFYEQFSDTNFLLNAIQSQLGCGSNNVDVDDLIEEKLVDSDFKKKKLLFFVGIHETGALDVSEFLADNAVQDADSVSDSEGAVLQGWTWPIIDSDVIDKPNNRVFDLLVTHESDEPIQEVLLDGIRDSWNNPQNEGVVIGSIDFDKVGLNPYSSYDSLGAVQRVVDGLGVTGSENELTVALTYRTPKIDHFSAVWWNHFESDDYTSFVCSDNQSDKRWEYIDTTMNVSDTLCVG